MTWKDDWAKPSEVGGKGLPLPMGRLYEGTIELATVEPHENAEVGMVHLQIGDILDAQTGLKEFVVNERPYQIGARKVFPKRIWLGYKGEGDAETTNRIAMRELKEIAWASGLTGLERTKKDKKWHIAFTDGAPEPLFIVAALQGRRVRFWIVKHDEWQGDTRAVPGRWTPVPASGSEESIPF